MVVKSLVRWGLTPYATVISGYIIQTKVYGFPALK